jgi:cytochrome c oxidase assembly factor 3
MSEGLKRAREPYRIRNALVGLGLGAFAVGVWAYSISAVKQDEFDDVDEEAKALGAGAGAANALANQGEPASSAPVVPMPTPKEVAAVAQATANIVLPGTLPLPPVTKPTPSLPTSSSPPPRGILQLLDKRWPRVLDPDSKTVVWGAPSVDNVGRMGGSRS